MGQTAAMDTLTVIPVAGALGARVEGVDLRRPLGPSLVDQILEMLDEHLVLFFPEQHLDDAQHLAFACAFGEPYVHPLSRAAGRTAAEGGAATVGHIVDCVETPPYQDKWHTDVSWDTEPPTYGTLRAIEMPARGGDTLWADARAAYAALSPVLQSMIEPLEAWHDMGNAAAFASKAGAEIVARTQQLFPGAAHPVVGVHPRTGDRYLNVNGEFTSRIVGMTPEESAVLLRLLVSQVTSPNFQVRYRWTVGDVAIWDERSTQHFAVADFLPARREMARVVVRVP
jgi:taurine dioxygenase